jgi:uncharacterized protein YabN with tetrapyrrole methylase and pyrophosphatase domain
MKSNKVYLGDSIYAEFDGYAVFLTTHNGLPGDPSNLIILEPEVFDKLRTFAASLYNNSNDQAEPRLLDDIGKHIPAIQRATKLQKRAASVGFAWIDNADFLNKLEEELGELREVLNDSANVDDISDGLGDLMFCCITLARHFCIDPEIALGNTNNKFVLCFNYIEEMLRKQNKPLDKATFEEMYELWDEAKLKLPMLKEKNNASI